MSLFGSIRSIGKRIADAAKRAASVSANPIKSFRDLLTGIKRKAKGRKPDIDVGKPSPSIGLSPFEYTPLPPEGSQGGDGKDMLPSIFGRAEAEEPVSEIGPWVIDQLFEVLSELPVGIAERAEPIFRELLEKEGGKKFFHKYMLMGGANSVYAKLSGQKGKSDEDLEEWRAEYLNFSGLDEALEAEEVFPDV